MRVLTAVDTTPAYDAAIVARGGFNPNTPTRPHVIVVDDPLTTPDSDGGNVWIGAGWWHHVAPADLSGPQRVTVCNIELGRGPALTLEDYVPGGIPECPTCRGES